MINLIYEDVNSRGWILKDSIREEVLETGSKTIPLLISQSLGRKPSKGKWRWTDLSPTRRWRGTLTSVLIKLISSNPSRIWWTPKQVALRPISPTKGDGNCWFQALFEQVEFNNILIKARNFNSGTIDTCVPLLEDTLDQYLTDELQAITQLFCRDHCHHCLHWHHCHYALQRWSR